MTDNSKRLVGFKQTRNALEQGFAEMVYITEDADEHIKSPIMALCEQNKVPITIIESKKKLGVMCKIDISAAIACDIKIT